MAEGVNPLPVLIIWFLPSGAGVHKVLYKLWERNIVPFFQSFGLGVPPVPADDLRSVALVKGSVVATCKLISVSGHQPLERFPHKDEFEVAAKAFVDLGRRELGERTEVACHVSLICGNGKRVSVAAIAVEDHKDTFPICTGYL